MPGPFRIFIGGEELTNYTSARVERSKENLTGSFSADIFMSYVPATPILTNVSAAAEVLVYVGDDLAFVGTLDRRVGTGDKSSNNGKASPASSMARSVSIGPDSYRVSIQARGVTKRLVDGSHMHPTTNMMQPTNREAVDALLDKTDIEVDWQASTIKLDKVRFRDGATVWEELQRIGNENAHFIYQTRDGKLRVTDGTGNTFGDPLILGENILTFSAEQGEDQQNQTIKVKGQRTEKTVWGEAAVVDTFTVVTDGVASNKAPITIQHYGDGTKDALERRAKFEANKRTAASKDVSIEVFHVVAQVVPWDVGNEHYVEIPPEGIFTVMECTSLTYEVDAEGTLKTSLRLSPLPASGSSGGAAEATPSPQRENLMSIGPMRRASLGVPETATGYPGSWGAPELAVLSPALSIFAPVADALLGLDKKTRRKDKLPKYKEQDK
jgi:prophage tail gpP-like protein